MARKDGTYDYKVTLSQTRPIKVKREVEQTVAEMTFMLYGYKSVEAARSTFVNTILPTHRKWVKGKKADVLKQIKVVRVGH